MNSRLRRRPYGRPTGAAPLWRTLVMVGLCQIAGAYAAEFSSALAALERGDYVSAVSQLDELSAQGDPLATTKLASLYQEGRGVPKDATRAAMLYEQAASRGDAEAQYNLGNMYLLGEGVPQDDDWAFTYYREAAKQGHAMAQKNVAEFYRAAGLTPPPEEVNAQPPAVIARTAKSNARPLPSAPAPPVGGTVPSPAAVSAAPADYSQDELNAMQMARTHGIRIAEAGSLPPQPPPLIVPRGSLIPTPPPAGEPAGMAAPSGDISTAKALLAAGKPADARPMLEAAANDGSAEAQYLLSQLLVTLSTGADDNMNALSWLQRAAAGGHADAQFLLGARYERGEGVMPDEAEAVTWYRAAARQGHREAAERLRAIYRDAGLPLPADVPPAADRRRSAAPVPDEGAYARVDSHQQHESLTCTRHACSLRVG